MSEHERIPSRTSRGEYIVDCSCGKRGLAFVLRAQANAAHRSHVRDKTTAQKQNPPFSRVLREGGSPRDGDWEKVERALDEMGF